MLIYNIYSNQLPNRYKIKKYSSKIIDIYNYISTLPGNLARKHLSKNILKPRTNKMKSL